MKKLLLSFSVIFSILSLVSAQQVAPVINKFQVDANVEVKNLNAPDVKSLLQEDKIRDNKGLLYRIGVAIPVDIRTNNSGTWTMLPNGDRQWQLRVKSEGAEALSFLFETFKLYGSSTLTIRDMSGKLVHKPMSASDVEDHGRQNAALCFGDDLIITLHEPNGVLASEIWIDRVMYNYRSTGNPNAEKINESASCEVNVNCSPVGDTWQDEKRGVARIYVVESGSAGWCTGSLVNNTAQDCKPYFLTALHCGVSTSAANMTQWKFYFRYESPNCTNPSTVGTLANYFITGCLRIADSGDGGGNSGSDFLLLQLGSATNTSTIVTQLKSTNFNAYWNGWNANSAAITGGAGIHHPAGDIKKISTFSGTTVSQSWGGTVLNTHWRLAWTSNSNGYGVTEGGSSGSPLFNNSQGYVIGTLTGGGSFCNSQNSPDMYGKMAYHWTSNGTTSAKQLKPWLDPTNSGVLTLAGSSNPCTPSTPVAPVANFVADQTNVTPGTTVSFTDQSTGIPTSWAWSISPATGWTYAGGTTASSQNPQVTFNTVGQYSVTLTATNAQGSDAEVKTNYIIVAQATGPCTPSISNACDEFIQNVTLNTINNTTACSTGGYASYTTTNTSLAKGSAYTVTVTPAVGANIGQAYTNDEIAVWIDFNNDFIFSTSERVGYVLVAAGWINQFNFTVPTSATTGAVRMRARISYQPDGAIDPCAVATYGETEDYTINITSGGGVGVAENSLIFANIYPNPTENELIVDLSAVSELVREISLVDITGKVVKSQLSMVNAEAKFDLSDVASGLYQVVIIGSESTLTKRIIKK